VVVYLAGSPVSTANRIASDLSKNESSKRGSAGGRIKQLFGEADLQPHE
jgi:hypothetical protein